MNRLCLVLNCGSSSLKLSLYVFDKKKPPAGPARWEASVQWKGHFEDPILEVKTDQNKKHSDSLTIRSLHDALTQALATLTKGPTAVLTELNEIQCIGHRIVHGGTQYRESVVINKSVKDQIHAWAVFAPLHNTPALQGIEIMESLLGKTKQFAIFDTAFHRTLPLEATLYPVPYSWFENDQIQRFGFHGISYQYCSRRAHELLASHPPQKMVICHLGAGASLAAIREGKCVDTTMGFTPLEGLMMNTRSGTIDPGIILERLKKEDLQTVTNDLYRHSGLLGLSGVSSDIREVLKQAENGHERSKLAIDVYLHRLASTLGSMIASLQGLDTLVFTAGIGENSPFIRKEISERFAFLGIKLDRAKNTSPPDEDCLIHSKDSKVRVLRIRTKEALEIARECWNHTAPKSI